MSLMKKIGIGVTSAIAIIAISMVIYSRLRPAQPAEPIEPVAETPSEPVVTPAIAGTFSNLATSADGKMLGYLDADTFTFVRYDLATATPAESLVKTVPDQVIWSDDLSKVLVKTTNLQSARTENPDFVTDRPDGAIVWSMFDLTSGERTILPDGIIQASWFESDVVVTKIIDGEIHFIAISTVDGKETKISEIKETSIEWKAAPGSRTIVAWTSDDEATIYLIDVAKKQIAQVKGSGLIKDLIIAPDGSLALFTAKVGPEQRLFKIDLATRTITKSEQKIDLSLAGWLSADRLGIINGDSVSEYELSSDSLVQTSFKITTQETIRQVVAADGELYLMADSGIFKPALNQ